MKNVTLIRHGESLGQTACHRGLKRTDPSLHDCFLSRKGIQQACDLRKDPMFETFQEKEYDLICTSPLTRAMATCILTMHTDTAQEEDRRAQQIIVRPEICELGKIPENRGRDTHTVIKDLRKQLSHIVPLPTLNGCLDNIDVSSIPPEWPDVEARTSKDDRNNSRMEGFLQWLLNDREEENIIVFCHYNVIKVLLNRSIDHVPNCIPIECVLTEEGELMLKDSIMTMTMHGQKTKSEATSMKGTKTKKKGKKYPSNNAQIRKRR